VVSSKPAAAPYDTWGLGEAAPAAPVVSNTTGGSMSAELQEEYDPARPNDYEHYRKLQREETQRAEEEAARRRQEEAMAQMPLPGPPPLPPSQQAEPQGGLPPPPPPPPGGGAAGGGQKCAPPPEGEPTPTRQRRLSQTVAVCRGAFGFRTDSLGISITPSSTPWYYGARETWIPRGLSESM